MANLPESATQHYRNVLSAQIKSLGVARRAWRNVSPDYISQSWREQLGGVIQSVTEQQRVAAMSGALSGSLSLGEMGSWGAPDAFVNVSSLSGFAADGRDLDGLLYSPATTAKTRIGNGMGVSDAMDSAAKQLSMIIKTMIADAARQAMGIMVAARPATGYVRMVNPPSCKDCIILAGRFYRWNAGFQRHPNCDCQHVPARVDSTAEAIANGWADDPYEVFDGMSEAERARVFGEANAKAIQDGADIYQVVNAQRGMTRTGLFTTEGMTKRGNAARLLQPGQRRATPELIYQWAGDNRAEALRLLEQHGYILPGGQVPGGILRGRVEGFGQFGRGGARRAASQAVLQARATGVRDGSVYTMTAAERRVYEAERDWLDVLQGRNPWSSAAVERRGGAKVRAADTPLTPQIAAQVEQRYLAAISTNGEAVAMRQALRAAAK